jgi:tetratricopeptide (TPR) repeat protein
MKLTLPALIFLSALAAACSNASAPVRTDSNGAVTQNSNDRPKTMIAHSGEDQAPPAGNDSVPGAKTKWSQSGNPIDVTELNAAVANAQKVLNTMPNDQAAKKVLSGAYFKRAVALTDARQYASALGDYRKAVKYDLANDEAKQWIDQITKIYDSMNKEAPKEGEEPPPLPYKKDENKDK